MVNRNTGQGDASRVDPQPSKTPDSAKESSPKNKIIFPLVSKKPEEEIVQQKEKLKLTPIKPLSPPLSPTPSLSPSSDSPPSPSAEQWTFLPQETNSSAWGFTKPLSFLRLPSSTSLDSVAVHVNQAEETPEETLSKALAAIKERKLPATWFTSSAFMKRVEAQTQSDSNPEYVIPSHLQTLSKTEFGEWNFPELKYLQTEQANDLTNPKNVENWKNFYAKLCVIEAVLKEDNPQAHIETLSLLFASFPFQNVLKKGVTLFGSLSQPDEGNGAQEIAHTFNKTVERWDAVLKKILENKLQEVTGSSIDTYVPPLQILSSLMPSSPLLIQAAAEFRKSLLDLSVYLSALTPDQNKELASIQNFQDELYYFINIGIPSSLNTQDDINRWKLFYAKLCVLNEIDPLLLAPLEHSILKDILKESKEYFKTLHDDNGNAWEIAATCDELFKKISAHEKKEEVLLTPPQIAEGPESKEEKRTIDALQPLSLKEKSALISIRYPCDSESETLWGPLYVKKTGSYLKERGIVIAQARANKQKPPSNLLNSSNYASSQKEIIELAKLLKNNTIDLSNQRHVNLLQYFYAKMCAVDDEPDVEKLHALFQIPDFLDNLINLTNFFDNLSGQNNNAKEIAELFKNILEKASPLLLENPKYLPFLLDSFSQGRDRIHLRKIIDKFQNKEDAIRTLHQVADKLHRVLQNNSGTNDFSKLEQYIELKISLSTKEQQRDTLLKKTERLPTEENMLSDLNEEIEKAIQQENAMPLFEIPAGSINLLKLQRNLINFKIAELTIRQIHYELPLKKTELDQTKYLIEKLHIEKTKNFFKLINLTMTDENKNTQIYQAYEQLKTIDHEEPFKMHALTLEKSSDAKKRETRIKLKTEMATTEVTMILNGILKSNSEIDANAGFFNKRSIELKFDLRKENLDKLFYQDIKFYLTGLSNAQQVNPELKITFLHLLEKRYPNQLSEISTYRNSDNPHTLFSFEDDRPVLTPNIGYLSVLVNGTKAFHLEQHDEYFSNFKGTSVDSALVQYVQRMPRIVLFTRELIKNDEPNASDMAEVVSLYSTFINELQRRNE